MILHVHNENTVHLKIGGGAVHLKPAAPIKMSPPVEVYDGAYSVTPSAVEQVLATSGKALEHDVVVAPIPSNYGLITWNGAILTVS